MLNQEVGVTGDDHAAFPLGVFPLLGVTGGSQPRFCRCGHVHANAAQRCRHGRVDVLVQMKADYAGYDLLARRCSRQLVCQF